MDIIYMREFVVLAETCNYQIAADDLALSQSALSKHIQKIEEELCISLFDRSKRTVRLNDNGQMFLKYARQICSMYDECEDALGAMNRDIRPTLCIGFMKVLGQYSLLEELADFEVAHPDFQMTMYEQNGDQIRSKLASGECDFIFTAEVDGLNADEFRKEVYKTENMMVILPPDHRLSNSDQISLADLVNEKMIRHNTPLETRILEKLFQESDFTPNIISSISSASTIMHMVEQGVGISIISEGCSDRYDSFNIKRTALKPSAGFPIYLVYRNKKLSRAARDFLNYFNNKTENTIE